MRVLPLSSLVEEVMAPHRDFGVKLELVEKSGRAGEPVGSRNPGILYGLGNLIDDDEIDGELFATYGALRRFAVAKVGAAA